MPIIDLFSRRQATARGELPDVFQYEEFPETLRAQLINLWNRGFDLRSPSQTSSQKRLFERVVLQLRDERGVIQLNSRRNMIDELQQYFLEESNIEMALDVVELIFGRFTAQEMDLGPVVEEVNKRFLQAAVGYQLEHGHVIRVADQLLHQEVVRPALHFLNIDGFEGPRQEFLNAHQHFRQGRSEEALTDALKAFESTLKVICERHGWAYDADRDGAQRLIRRVMAAGLLPDFAEHQLNHTRGLLQSALPTVRNRQGGHGQGAEVRDVPNRMVAFAIHVCAANIVLLVEASEALERRQ